MGAQEGHGRMCVSRDEWLGREDPVPGDWGGQGDKGCAFGGTGQPHLWGQGTRAVKGGTQRSVRGPLCPPAPRVYFGVTRDRPR